MLFSKLYVKATKIGILAVWLVQTCILKHIFSVKTLKREQPVRNKYKY